MMAEQAVPSEKWDYIIYADPDTGRIPVKHLNVEAGQTITVRVLNLASNAGNVYYADSVNTVNPRSLKVSAVWTVQQGYQDYQFQTLGTGLVRISSGTTNADGEAAYYSFLAEALYVRIT